MSPSRTKRSQRRPADRSTLTDLEQLPNVGPAVAGYLRRAGVDRPQDLVGRDPYAMYDAVCRVSGQRLDPCLLDSFIAAVRFMAGDTAKPWWAYTAERQRSIIKVMGPMFQANGLATTIALNEGIDARSTWTYIDAMRNDANVWPHIGLLNWHLYGTNDPYRSQIRDFGAARCCLASRSR